jgi:hypothetical protein
MSERSSDNARDPDQIPPRTAEVNTAEGSDADLKAGLRTQDRIVLEHDVPMRRLTLGA